MGLFDNMFGNNSSKNGNSSPNEPGNGDELMDEEKFWELIAIANSKSDGDYEQLQEELGEELAKLSGEEIIHFDNRFSFYRGQAYTWDLWAAAYIMNGGCSDDCFMDFRGWLIGKGKETYFKALEDVESLAEIDYDMEEEEWEGMGYVAMTAFEEKTGSELSTEFEENLTISGEDWEEEELESKLPILWKKWGFG